MSAVANAAASARRYARIVLSVRRAFASRGIDNLFENATLLVEHDEEEYVPDLALARAGHRRRLMGVPRIRVPLRFHRASDHPRGGHPRLAPTDAF
jgi:hypothetical protein